MTNYMIPDKEPTMNEATRAWIYRIVTAVIPILTAYGVVAETEAPLFAALAAAILGTGLATFNTSTSSEQ